MSRCQTRIAKQTKNLVSGITLNFHLRNTMLTRTESTGDWPAHVQARTILTSVLFLHSSRHILSSTIPGQSLEGIPTEQLNSRTSFASTLPTIFFQTLAFSSSPWPVCSTHNTVQRQIPECVCHHKRLPLFDPSPPPLP